MYNALFFSFNSKYTHASLAPWCLLAGVKKYCTSEINASVAEGTVNEREDVILARIAAQKPDFIGFCTYIWNVKAVMSAAEKYKKMYPDTIIALGGPEVSYNSEEILSAPYIDYVISGEGEQPCAVLLDSIVCGEDIPEGFGICTRERISPPFISCEEPPSPYCGDFFAALGNRIPYIETSRGCPYSCAFCLSGRCGGVRYFDMDRVKSEIILLAQNAASTVKFVDRTFNAHKRRAKEILRFIIENNGAKIPRGICFHFEIAGDILDDETIEIIRTAPKGLFQFEIGMQSFNEQTLAYIDRRTDCTLLKNNILRLTGNGNAHIHIDLIAGLPYEDMSSFRDSFNTAFSLCADMLQMGFLKLLHGADMRENREKYPCEFSHEPPYEVTSTPWLTVEEIATLKHTEDALDRLCNSGRFRRTSEYIMHRCGKTPFDILRDFGNFAADHGTSKITLDDYTALVFDYFSRQDGIDKAVLRDTMVCDRLSTNSFGKLPPALQISEPILTKCAKQYLESSADTKQKKGVKRSIAILYSQCRGDKICAVYADYNDSDKNRHGISAPEYELRKFYFEHKNKAFAD